MSGKQMEGDNRQRREKAKEAREQGERPSEQSATLGASQQRKEAPANATHEEKLELKSEGKLASNRSNAPTPKPRSNDS